MHSENFYRDFMNLVYGWSLENANNRLQNIEEYAKKGYTFKFVSIAENADQLRQQIYDNLYNIGFNPTKDIFDISSLEKDILNFEEIINR